MPVDRGPSYDIIGDVHACLNTFQALLEKLGYTGSGEHAEGRMLVFVGDVCGRGLHSAATLALVRDLTLSGRAAMVKGNHETRLAESLRSTEPLSEEDLEMAEWIEALPLQLLLDGKRLLVVHAAIRSDLIGQEGPEAEYICLHGGATFDEHQREIRPDWQTEYDGEPFVVAGHNVVKEPRWVDAGGGSVDIDTGASHGPKARDRFTGESFDGYLTALRWPEMETVSIPTSLEDLHPRKLH